VQPAAHEPLLDIKLLVRNINLPCILNMLHLITNLAACLQPRQLCSRKQSSDNVLCFMVTQKSTIPLRCHVRMNETHLKY